MIPTLALNPYVGCLLISAFTFATAYAQTETPSQSLNQYVAFLNQSVGVLTSRFELVQAYQADVNRYQTQPDFKLSLPSSGPVADGYYRKALAGNGLTAAERGRLNTRADVLWHVLTQLDQTGKALETYVHLQTYQDDSLKQSNKLLGDMQALFSQFSREKALFYGQIQRVYRRYQPYLPTDPYLVVEKELEQVLLAQQQLLDSLPCYLHEDSRFEWPVGRVQQSILSDEKRLAAFETYRTIVDYPASAAITGFAAALLALQTLKRRAVDDYTFAARQSARHGNTMYLSLLKQYNQDLLATHRSFVNYSQSARRLLDAPAFSPVLTPEPLPSMTRPVTQTIPFQDSPLPPVTIKKATAPATRALVQVLNDYVAFINESLRQLHGLQVLLRDYQASAAHQRNPPPGRQRAELTYSPGDYRLPMSAYDLLMSASKAIPLAYRPAITSQAAVLLAMLREMDELSIELIGYTTQKEYLHDHLHRSDAILDRYAYLFETFDLKKEQLYTDIRRIYESYPVANPTSSWHVAGKALQKTLDNTTTSLFGVKAYLRGNTTQLPATDELLADARRLLADEYVNLTGLPRFGRSNGLCPYSPYEDLAENSSRFAGMVQRLSTAPAGTPRHPYESFYYFYNNELVHQYNTFCELATVGLLKAINQPDIFAFRRLPLNAPDSAPQPTEPPTKALVSTPRQTSRDDGTTYPAGPTSRPATPGGIQTAQQRHDTMYVERTDTVYLDRVSRQEVRPSLTGFAANNMVLLLDVSGSMDSPVKLPLLKRSIKALLALLRPEDQLSIVVYSGRARVVLKPTSGANVAEITRAIDALQSTGDTDGDGGLRLAYKVANKSYIRAGNNRIVLATDGEFAVSDQVLQLIEENARQDVYLTVFTFGRNLHTGQNLKKLSQLGHGSYAHITTETADVQLIMEAQAKQQPGK